MKDIMDVQDENKKLKEILSKMREDKVSRNKDKLWVEMHQVGKVIKQKIIPKCNYIQNSDHHTKVMLFLCQELNVKGDEDKENFIYKYEVDLLRLLSQYRNNAAQGVYNYLKS